MDNKYAVSDKLDMVNQATGEKVCTIETFSPIEKTSRPIVRAINFGMSLNDCPVSDIASTIATVIKEKRGFSRINNNKYEFQFPKYEAGAIVVELDQDITDDAMDTFNYLIAMRFLDMVKKMTFLSYWSKAEKKARYDAIVEMQEVITHEYEAGKFKYDKSAIERYAVSEK